MQIHININEHTNSLITVVFESPKYVMNLWYYSAEIGFLWTGDYGSYSNISVVLEEMVR